MTALKKFLQNIYGLSRTETNGFLILLPLVVIFVFSEPIYSWWVSNQKDDFSAEKATLDSLTSKWEIQKAAVKPAEANKGTTAKPLPFDPNTASQNDLIAIGFSEKLASRIIHYREVGGKFVIKADLKKIYGMDSQLYQKLHGFIKLPDEVTKPVRENFAFTSLSKKVPIEFDLNEADTAQLKSIYGIGSKLSARIVKYRESLGGFVKMEQLSEVYGLDSTVINRLLERSFLSKDFQPKKININTATEQELDAHPYITKTLANAIAAYRFQHGNFKAVDDLRNLHIMKENTSEKISPYLKTE